jgi:small subunit ribosomal protein S6
MNEEKKSYQLTCFISPDLKEEELNEAIKKIEQLITGDEGDVQYAGTPVSKSLSYKINKHQDAFYFLLNFLLPASKIRQLCQKLNLEKNILRYLITVRKQLKENKEVKKSSRIKKELDSKMIDRIEPMPEPAAKIEKKEKSRIQELDKKLDEILNQ